MGQPTIGAGFPGRLPLILASGALAGLLSFQTRTERLSISQVLDDWPWPRLEKRGMCGRPLRCKKNL